MGEMRVPVGAMYGATTARAVENFPISGIPFSRSFIRALGLIKASAAVANRDLGLLAAEKADLIVAAAREVADGGGTTSSRSTSSRPAPAPRPT